MQSEKRTDLGIHEIINVLAPLKLPLLELLKLATQKVFTLPLDCIGNVKDDNVAEILLQGDSLGPAGFHDLGSSAATGGKEVLDGGNDLRFQ